MKGIIKFTQTLRTIVKYAGIILVVVDIISYAATKFEQYTGSKEPEKNEPNNIQ